MKIHWKLIKEYIEKSSCCPCEWARLDKEECVNFVSCGPQHRCKNPCNKCLYWTGYGIEEEGR